MYLSMSYVVKRNEILFPEAVQAVKLNFPIGAVAGNGWGRVQFVCGLVPGNVSQIKFGLSITSAGSLWQSRTGRKTPFVGLSFQENMMVLAVR